MAHFGVLSIVIFVIISTISTQEASALKCWVCDSAHQQFCGDKWDPSKITEEDKLNHYGVCQGKTCMKVAITDGTATLGVSRGCAVNASTAQADCKSAEEIIRRNGLPNAVVKCLLCDSDGCNGAIQ